MRKICSLCSFFKSGSFADIEVPAVDVPEVQRNSDFPTVLEARGEK